MSIRPDDSHGIISLLLNPGWVDFRVNALLFDEHGAAEFIDAPCTLAAEPESVGVDFLGFLFFFDDNCSGSRIIVHINFNWGFFKLFTYLLADFVVNLFDLVLIREHEGKRSP